MEFLFGLMLPPCWLCVYLVPFSQQTVADMRLYTHLGFTLPEADSEASLENYIPCIENKEIRVLRSFCMEHVSQDAYELIN